VKTISNKVVKFIDLYICAKMVGGGSPLLCENLAETDLLDLQISW